VIHRRLEFLAAAADDIKHELGQCGAQIFCRLIRVCADDVETCVLMRFGQLVRRFEFRIVNLECIFHLPWRKMGGKSIEETELRCNMRRIRGGPEYIDRYISTVPGNRHDLHFTVRLEVADLFVVRGESIDPVMVIPSDDSSSPHVSDGCADEADIEPVAEYRLHSAEFLSDDEGRVVRQHDAAAAHTEAFCVVEYMMDQLPCS